MPSCPLCDAFVNESTDAGLNVLVLQSARVEMQWNLRSVAMRQRAQCTTALRCDGAGRACELRVTGASLRNELSSARVAHAKLKHRNSELRDFSRPLRTPPGVSEQKTDADWRTRDRACQLKRLALVASMA